MGQSLVKNYIHIVFSTKYRQPLIDSKIETDLHKYIGGICNNLECIPIKVGGYIDHIHILCLLSKKISLMELLNKVKSSSSSYAKSFGADYQDFFWQNGYGAFSVSPKAVQRVVKYIENQHEHHSKKDFKDEFRGFLKKNDAEYDERYVWD